MKRLEQVVTIISKGANCVAIATIAVMMCAVFADVCLRTFFTRNIPGVTELAQGCWVLMALSFGIVVLENANTMVDIFVDKMPPKVKRIILAAVDVIAIVFCILLGWRAFLKALSTMDSNTMLVSLGVKEWPFAMLFAISFFLAAFATVLVLIREVKACNEECKNPPVKEIEKEDM